MLRQPLLASVARATLVRREILAHGAARAAHRDAVCLDDVRRLCVPVLLVLHAAARVALHVEGVHVTLLFAGGFLLFFLAPGAEFAEFHEPVLTGSRLH